jgi:hypothetical protein
VHGERAVAEGGNGSTVFLACAAVVAVVLPLLTGFAIGRWWAVALVLWLLLATLVADGLAPMQRPPPSALEFGWEAAAAVVGCLHILLLLAGVGLRKLIRPRPPAEPWTTRLI